MKADDNISVIKGVLEEELERNRRMKSRYVLELEKLPKGSIFIRNIGNQEYCYLKYRENGKIIAKYLGNKKTIDIGKLNELIIERKHIESVIKRLLDEEKEIEKVIKPRRT